MARGALGGGLLRVGLLLLLGELGGQLGRQLGEQPLDASRGRGPAAGGGRARGGPGRPARGGPGTRRAGGGAGTRRALAATRGLVAVSLGVLLALRLGRRGGGLAFRLRQQVGGAAPREHAGHRGVADQALEREHARRARGPAGARHGARRG